MIYVVCLWGVFSLWVRLGTIGSYFFNPSLISQCHFINAVVHVVLYGFFFLHFIDFVVTLLRKNSTMDGYKQGELSVFFFLYFSYMYINLEERNYGPLSATSLIKFGNSELRILYRPFWRSSSSREGVLSNISFRALFHLETNNLLMQHSNAKLEAHIFKSNCLITFISNGNYNPYVSLHLFT